MWLQPGKRLAWQHSGLRPDQAGGAPGALHRLVRPYAQPSQCSDADGFGQVAASELPRLCARQQRSSKWQHRDTPPKASSMQRVRQAALKNLRHAECVCGRLPGGAGAHSRPGSQAAPDVYGADAGGPLHVHARRQERQQKGPWLVYSPTCAPVPTPYTRMPIPGTQPDKFRLALIQLQSA